MTGSAMRRETDEAPEAVERFLSTNARSIAEYGARLRQTPPDVVVTCARGSSDHAASYGKYLLESFIGVPVASAAPSMASLFSAPVTTRRALCLAVSQSGRSPDLLSTVASYRTAGAPVIALVNDEASPLAEQSDCVFPLRAGPELSVAATKSCIVAMAGLAALTATWSGDQALTEAVERLPAALAEALALDWDAAIAPLADANQMLVIGRGYSFGIAQEVALKLKETCAIQAEPFSSAEVRHGPMAIVGEGFPVLALATSDAAGDDVTAVSRTFAERGAILLLAHAGGDSLLPAKRGHPAIEPILMLASFYRMAERLARRRGLDPDRPPHLSKVTRTL